MPGPVTGLPSICTSPALACSSPATIRRNVVLPHPDGPTIEMNSPSAISIPIWLRTSRSVNFLHSPATLSFGAVAATARPSAMSVLRPGHETLLEPGEARSHGDAGGRQYHHRREEIGHVESVGRLADELAKAGARAEELGDDNGDQAAAEPEEKERRQRDGRRRVKPGDPGLKNALGALALRHHQPHRDADDARD